MNIIQREYEMLRGQRVRLRKTIEQYSKRACYEQQNLYGVDGHLNCIAGLQAQLRGTERRWQELHLLLGKRLPGPPVKLAVTPRSQPVQLRSSTTRSGGPSYLTRALFPR
jgi:hypothetical protein